METTTVKTNSISFQEVQQFRQRWIWVLLVPAFLLGNAFIIYGVIQQIFLGQPWGNKPVSNVALASLGFLAMLFETGFIYTFYSLKLTTEVKDDGLYVRFYPLSRQTIPFKEIISYEICTYRPIKDYGGWGIRYSRKGKAYTISGNRGVQLTLGNDERLLIGSQRPEELAAAIGKGKGYN